jgi:cell division protein FtsI/penicillin-binding protein 2
MTRRRPRRPPGRGLPPGRRVFPRTAEAEAEHHRLIRLRAAVLFVILALVLAGLGARLVSLHVVQAGALERMAARQQTSEVTIDPQRGRLLDRWGRPLAVNIDAESVYAVPSRIQDHRAFARAVAPALGMRVDEVLGRLTPARHFVWLARKVQPGTSAALRALPLGEGIGFLVEPRRRYPNGRLAAHVLGFAGIDNQGLAGAELAFDRYLRGEAGLARVERDAMGRPRLETRTLIRPPVGGADVVLTIDQVLQHIAERELDSALAATRASWGAVVMMDPENGELLALAAAPRFDPNAYDRARPELWNNPVLAHSYEPGSTFKVVLAAAALDAGAVDEREVFHSDGSLAVPGGYVIREARGRRFSRQTLPDIIRNSSNVGAAMVATRLGVQRYHAAIRRFGFGAPTGVDLRGEAVGLVPAPAQWRGAVLQTAGFGQGISATPLQMLVAGAALAHDGALVRPRVLRAVRDADGRALEVPAPEPGRQVVSPEVARRVVAMMVDAVAHGSGAQAAIEGYPVAGKTGTAQKPSPAGGYLPDAYVASFLGIVPAGRPRLAVLVVLDAPRGEYFGSVVAAPLFHAVASQALWHLRVAPSSEPATAAR